MPFFLKPCLKFRKKKNKKKSKLKDKIKQISDVTVPVTTDEIWQECEIDSSTSNFSDNRDHTVSYITITKCLSVPASSEIDEISADESTTNQSNEIRSHKTSIIVSDEHIRLKSDEQSGNVCLEEKNNRQVDIDIERNQSLGASQTVSDEQVSDIGKTEKNILDEGEENSDVSLNGEILTTFSEGNDLRYSDLNNIDINTNVMEKLEELRYIQNSFKQGDQRSFENIVEKNNRNISEEFPYTDNKSAETYIKHLNSQETKLSKICSNIKRKRGNFTCGTFRDDVDYDTDSKTHPNETSSEYANYERSENTTSLKQNRNNIHKDSCNENSSSNFVSKSTEPTEDVTESQEIDSQKVDNECLKVEENLDINYSIIDESQHSDRSAHDTSFLNSIKSSSDNENSSTREEVYNYSQTDHLQNEFLSKTLNKMETLDFHSNATIHSMVEPSISLPTDEIPVISEHNSLSKGSQPELSISRENKENDINDEDCNSDEMIFLGNEAGKICSSNDNLKVYEIKDKSLETDVRDSYQCNLDVRSGYTDECEFGESGLNVSQERVYLPNKLEDSEVKREEEKREETMMNSDEQFRPDGKKCSHLTLQENDISTPINLHNVPLNFEDVNCLNHKENFYSEEYILSDLDEGCNFRANANDCANLKNDENGEKSFHLKKDFKGDKNIDNCYENFIDKAGHINPYPIKTENTVCNSYGNNDIFHDISSRSNNEGNQTRDENKPYEQMEAKLQDFFVEEDNPDHYAQNVDNNCSIASYMAKVNKKSTEENIAFKLAEDLGIHSDLNTSSCNKRNISISADIVKAEDDSQLQSTTNHSKHTDVLYTEDNYTVLKSTRMYKEVTNYDNSHYDNSLHHSESIEKVYDYGKHDLYDDKTCEFQVEKKFDVENTKSEELKEDAALENYESSTLNEIYEKHYAFKNTQSPKRLNRYSNISSTSESSTSSRFSDKSCSKAADVEKKESKIFSISAWGDSRHNENTDGTMDDLKIPEKEYDMIRLEEAKKAVSRNEHHGMKLKPKLTINITRRNKNDAMEMSQLLKMNQYGDNLKEGFKSMDPSGIDRIRESIEIFKKKKEQALSDMKSSIRVIPVKKAEVLKIRTKPEKIGISRSPFLKVSPNSNVNEFERNLKELMPETLLGINKDLERHPAVHENNNVRELSGKKATDISPSSPSSDSESESSQTSENISPFRKRILNVSRDIRSPKYPFRTLQRMPMGNSHIIKRPVIIKSPKVNFVAYLTKDDKNRYTIKKGYRMYNAECRNIQILSPDYRHSDYKTNNIENAVNNRSTSPDYLKPKFDDMFKRYARKGRSNGELISYKRSTEWLRDAGLIGKSLTAEEANNAFKCTAGVKVALNKGDYRHYLKKLARLKRLNYNEIYKRLCSLNERFNEE